MTSKRPPRLASFLLNRISDNAPLAGDLEEEFAAGRSRAWYWRQVLLALVLGPRPSRRFDPHDLFAVQGLFMQFVMLMLISVCAVFTVKLISVYVGSDPVLRALIGPRGVREPVRLALSFGVAIPAGVAFARLHTRSRRGAVLALSVIVPLWAFANVYVMNGHGNLDSALPHVLALLVFVIGLLSGGIHADAVTHSGQARSAS
jgi:hypothetical protein